MKWDATIRCHHGKKLSTCLGTLLARPKCVDCLYEKIEELERKLAHLQVPLVIKQEPSRPCPDGMRQIAPGVWVDDVCTSIFLLKPLPKKGT